jgi:hypothetical protein
MTSLDAYRSGRYWIAGLGFAGLVGCGSGGQFPDAPTKDGPPPVGTLTLTWTIESLAAQTLSCSAVLANSVVADIQNLDQVGGVNDLYSCVDGTATSVGVAPGNYRVRLSLNGPGGQLSQLPFVGNVKVVSGQSTSVAVQKFSIDAQGTLRIKLASRAGGNCAAAPNGAAIDSMALELRDDPSLTCVPTTFMIAAGANRPASSYVSTCGAPVAGPCIDADQTISIVNGPSGPYRVAVTGSTSGTSCWTAEQQTSIPTGQLVRDLSINLGPTGTAGCP